MSLQTVKDPADANGKAIVYGPRGGMSYRTSDATNTLDRDSTTPTLPPNPYPNEGLLAEIGDEYIVIGIFISNGQYVLKHPKDEFSREVCAYASDLFNQGYSISDAILITCRKYNLHFMS